MAVINVPVASIIGLMAVINTPVASIIGLMAVIIAPMASIANFMPVIINQFLPPMLRLMRVQTRSTLYLIVTMNKNSYSLSISIILNIDFTTW
jgi:hypothetical protein